MEQNKLTSKELTFSAILAFTKKSFARIALYCIITVFLLAVVFSALLVFPVVKTNVYAAVSFNYKGIELGFAPDETKFNVSGFTSMDVLSKAVKNTNLNIDVYELKQHISVCPIMPKEVAEKLQFSNGNVQNQAELAKYLDETSLFATDYVLTFFDIGKLKLTGTQAQILLNEVLRVYEEDFLNRYFSFTFEENILENLNSENYEYIEIGDALAAQTQRIKTIVENLASEAPDFISPSNKLSFSALLMQAQLVEANDISRFYAFILNGNVISDPAQLNRYFDYKTSQLNSLILQESKRGDALEKAVAEYVKYPLFIVTNDNNTNAFEIKIPTAEYDKLIGQLTAIRNSQAYYETQLELTLARKAQLSNKSTFNAEEKSQAEEKLAGVKLAVSSLIEKTSAFAAEYFLYKKANGTITTKVSPTLQLQYWLDVSQLIFILCAAMLVAAVAAMLVTYSKTEKAKAAIETDRENKPT